MEVFVELSPKLTKFIQAQKMYFVATAGADGYVNLSPKGLDSLCVSNSKTVHWLNLTGSGNETAAHVLENQRMTIMFCSFERQPLILRLYGKADMVYKDQAGWSDVYNLFEQHDGARQIFTLNIERVQTSCGFAVPYYEFVGDRNTLDNWTNKKSTIELEQYKKDKNSYSIDGRDTGLIGLDQVID